jgi:hypothetical protein
MRYYIDPSDAFVSDPDLIGEGPAEMTDGVCVLAGFCDQHGDKVFRDLSVEPAGFLTYWTRTDLGDAELLSAPEFDVIVEPELDRHTLEMEDVCIEIYDAPNWDHVMGLCKARNNWLAKIIGRIRNIDSVRSFRRALGFLRFQAVANKLRVKEGKTRDNDGNPLPIGLDFQRYAVAMNSLLLWGVTKGFIDPEKAKAVKVKEFPPPEDKAEKYRKEAEKHLEMAREHPDRVMEFLGKAEECLQKAEEYSDDALNKPRAGIFMAEQMEEGEVYEDLPYESNILHQQWESKNYDSTQRLYWRMGPEAVERWLHS